MQFRRIVPALARVAASPLDRFGSWLNAKMLAFNQEMITLEKEFDAKSNRVRG